MSTAAEAYQSVDSDDFYIQLDLTSNDTNFNNTHPRLQVRVGLQLLQPTAGGCIRHLAWKKRKEKKRKEKKRKEKKRLPLLASI